MTSFNLYMGLPASGKSTIAHKRLGNDAVIIDSDAVRERILGSINDQKHNSIVFDHMLKETCECLARGISVCYVATNLSSRRRIDLLANLRKKFPDIEYNCYVIVTPIDVCHERNSTREKRVPTYVIDRMARQFEPPLPAENYDNIYIINNFKDTQEYRFKYDKMLYAYGDQGNSHHKYTLYGHCKVCGELAYHYFNTEDKVASHDEADVIFAAYWHDVGKIFTATRWEKDNYAETHYPNHSNISSYLILTMGFNLHTAQLAFSHMFPYCDEAAQKTWKLRLGDKLWEEVQQLHWFDEASH